MEKLTGQELLDELLTLTPEELKLEVTLEGCDCAGDLGGVSIDTYYDGSSSIFLHRTDGRYVDDLIDQQTQEPTTK